MAAEPVTWVENYEDLRKVFRLVPDYERTETRNIRIAVLDNGFQGAKEHKYLPDSRILVEKYAEKDIELDANDAHGRLMAQIAWAMTGRRESGPHFYLLNARGTDNFKKAVEYCLALPRDHRIDIALVSMNFESTGNFRGDGYINAQVDRLAASGTIVIVAAGNYGGNVFNGSVALDAEKWVNFGSKNYLELRSRIADDPSRPLPAPEIILSWNAFTSDPEEGTDKDLDLYLYDERDELLAKKELTQVRKKTALAEGETYTARERVEFPGRLEQGKKYRVRVKAKNGIFNPERDYLRITLKTNRPGFFSDTEKKPVDAIAFLDATPGREIMVPADNPNVVTVGELSPFSAKGPTMDGRAKPDVLMTKTNLTFSDKSPETGTSVAAAELAGIAAVLKAEALGLTADMLKRWVAPAPESQMIPLEEARRYLPHLVNAVERENGGRPLAAYLGADRQLSLVVPEYSKGMQDWFQGFDWATDAFAVDQLELFVAVRQDPRTRQLNVRGYPVGRGGAARPWDQYRENPAAFARLTRAWRVWQTPSQARLRAAAFGR